MAVTDPSMRLGGHRTNPTDMTNAPFGGVNTSGGTSDQQNAFAMLSAAIAQYGLPSSLAQWAWNELLNNRPASQILLDMYQQPAFQQRFPAIAMRQKAGLPAISPAEYVSYENTALQMFRAAGFPPSFYDSPSDFTNLIAADVSPAELSQRVSLYQQAAYQVPTEVRQQLKTLYGIDEGGIAAYFADPSKALPLLQQQFTAAQDAGEANVQQFGQLTRAEAERLAALGVTDQQALSGFGQVYKDQQLFQQLPGEAPGTPGRADALGLVAGQAAAQQAVETQALRRRAPFQAGGGFTQTQTGVVGLGSATTNS